MIYFYATTQKGDYHIKNNTLCQDYHSLFFIDDHFAMANVSDGVGSEKHSDIASKIASLSSLNYCRKKIKRNTPKENILGIIKDSFTYALDAIINYVKEKNEDINEFDTTLSLTIYLDGCVYYGHVGDGGILALLSSGDFISLTEKQNDINGNVYPLIFKDKWSFGIQKEVASILLATDGLYDLFFPILLKEEETKIYVLLANYLMSNETLKYNSKNIHSVNKSRIKYIRKISPNIVYDDKTLVVLMDDSVKENRKDNSYYQKPDWEALKRKRRENYLKQAYPNLKEKEN